MTAASDSTSPPESVSRIRPDSWQRISLLWLVFCGGVGVMGLEMTASQLIAPYFGSTISVWTSLIGLVMIFLTAGYFLGGALADRMPSRAMLAGLIAIAGTCMLLVPFISAPVLQATWRLTPTAGLLAGSLVGSLVLFSVPTVLLGCVCPFAMKLSIQDLGRTGRASGRIYATSAIGSVVGTFLPVLVTIEAFGVRRSIMLFGLLLLAAAVLLIIRPKAALGVLLLTGVGVSLLPQFSLPEMLPTQGMVETRESPYNYLQVVQKDDTRLLFVDWGVFSFYTPGEFRTWQYYDYLLLAPLLRAEPAAEWLDRALVIGLGAGTVAKQATQVYGAIEIDGVEIDPAIVELARKHFDMNEPNLQVHETDGRAFLAAAKEPYDWVIIDAYQGSEIPAHLITKEFFAQVRNKLTPGGVLAINVAWWETDDTEILERLVATVKTAFPEVCAITGISHQSGAVILAGDKDASPYRIVQNAEDIGHPALLEIAEEVFASASPQLEFPAGLGEPLTDDRAPIDEIVDRMYLKARQEAFEREQEVLKL